MISPPASGPLLPLIVHRQRLHQLLDRVAAPGIVVVSAQAAQGKTTLIKDYLETTGGRTCWMALGPADVDPDYFGRHLHEVFGPHLASRRRMTAHPTSRPTNDVIASLFRHLPPDLNLVFDGWQRIGSPALALKRINAIVAVRPAQGRIYLISREDLPIALQRDRLRRQALVLTDQDLAFTAEEIGAFFDIVNGISLEAWQREEIHRLTAGWAGGLVILAEALQRQAGDPLQVLSAPTMPEQLRTESESYFKEEIFRPQAEAMQTFLTRAALLDEVPAELMHLQFERRQADQLFAEAVRQHLFIQPLTTSQDRWAFRMNPLFRAFLRNHARTVLAPETANAILTEAARRCQDQGQLASAARYYIRADDRAPAEKLITTIGMEMLIDGRFDEIPPWTSRLPTASLHANPWLGLLQAAAFRIRGGRRTIAELQAVHRLFTPSGHIRGQMLSLAYLIETAVFSGHDAQDLTQWITAAEALLQTTRPLPHFGYAKALLWLQIGLGTLAEFGGDLQKGLSACQNAIVLGQRIACQPIVVNAQRVAAQALVQSGEFDQARERLKAARNRDGIDRFPEYGALCTLVEFHLALIDAQMSAATDRLAEVQAAIDQLGLIRLYPSYLEALGLLQVHRKQFSALEKTHRHLHDVAILLDNSTYRAVGYWLAGLSCYHQEHFRRARSLMRYATEISNLPTMQRGRNRSLEGFIALNTGQFSAAAKHFRKALSIFEAHGLALYACEAQLGMALVKNARQETAAAERYLDAAFRRAARRHYDQFHIIRPVDLARACALSIQRAIPSAGDHARHLLVNRLEEAAIQTMVANETANPLAQSIDASATHHAIYRARIPVLVIRTLGGLQILHNGTDRIKARAWQGSRPALLFKAILVHGGRHIPKDILIEAIWPDQAPDKSLRNFKVTLHRLRKMLEPDLSPARGSAYIHLKDNLVSLDKHLCEVDTDALHRLCKRARRMETAVDGQELIKMSHEAGALYQGDFLPEEPYLAWTEVKRTTLRQEFIQLMYRLGRRLRDQQEFRAARRCYRHIVRTDPGQEKAQRHLMQLLNAAGRGQEAVQLYQVFRSFMQTEIGAVPDPETVQLFDTIRRRLRSA